MGPYHGGAEGPHGRDPPGCAGDVGGVAVGQGGPNGAADVAQSFAPRRRAAQPQERQQRRHSQVLGGRGGEMGLWGGPKMEGGVSKWGLGAP